jgi:hypothetical protein
VITLLSILLHWIRTLKELQSPLRLLGMALSCAGLILYLGSQVVRETASTPRFVVGEREPTEAESLSQWAHPHDTESRSFQQVSQCHKEDFNLATNRPTQEVNSY